MAFPFKWVREQRWRSEPGQVIALEMNPQHVLPAVSVQPEWQGNKGIIRGVKEDGYLVEDHIREELREGEPVDAGRRISGADEMRQHVWTVDKHKEEFLKRHPGEPIVAWVGNGNLLSNPHFVGHAEGATYHLSSEGEYFRTRTYSSLVVRKREPEKRVTIESISYGWSASGVRILGNDGRDITDEIEYATFGQQLVSHGEPIDTPLLKKLAREGQFYDLRHLFLFGRIPMGEKRWVDAGLSAFWDDTGHMNRENLGRAIDGCPIVLNVSQFCETDVRESMDDKGYDKVEEPTHMGQYSLKEGQLQVILLEGLYPHNMIGIREDGMLISVVLRGLSNRVGVTIRGAAEIMKALGARDALLLDNGGDVMMSFGQDQVLGSAERERNRLRSVLLFRLVSQGAQLEPKDLRLAIYPKQFVESP